MSSPQPSQLSPEQLAVLQGEDNGPTVIAVVSVFTAIGSVFVCLRLYTRLIIIHNFGLEDYCILASFAHAVAMAACQIEGAKHGGSRHMMFLTLPQLQTTLKYLYWSILTYCNALTLTKLSILLQYRRIFNFTSLRIPIYVVGAIVLAVGISALFVVMFTCIPVSAFWDVMKKPTAKCIDSNAFSFAGAGLNIITDILIAALPVRAIWQLQVPRRQRIALMCILTLGWFVCVVSIARLHGFTELEKHPDDPTFYGAAPAYWSAIEVNLGIVCACAPALKPLIAKAVPGFSTRYSSRKSTFRGTKESHKDFIELKGKNNSTNISGVVEQGNGVESALPTTVYKQAPHKIHVQTELDQQYEDIIRDTDAESERNLVTRPLGSVSRQ